MFDKLDIPSELAGSYKRIARRIPVDLKKDDVLMQTIVDYLKMGGERLARQAVEAAKQTLELELAERKKRARQEALIRAAEARLAAAGGEAGDDDDYNDDDDEDDDDGSEDMKSY